MFSNTYSRTIPSQILLYSPRIETYENSSKENETQLQKLDA